MHLKIICGLLKVVLRSSELVLGLKINYSKSSIMGANVDNAFLKSAAHLLNYKVGKVPFHYLSLPVAANPRKASTWQPLIDMIN